MEDGVHHHLEGGWGVCKSEEHDCWLAEPFGCKEGCLPFISGFDVYVIVSPSDIKFYKQCASTQVIDGLGNERRDVAISLHPFIDRVIVLDGSQFSIFLLDKEEVCGIRAPGFMDHPPFQVFSHKFLCFCDFTLGKREESSWQ